MIAFIVVAVVGMVTMVCSVIADNVPLAIMGSALFLAPSLMATLFLDGCFCPGCIAHRALKTTRPGP